MLIGIDNFVSQCRALTNMCGNSVISIFVSKWEGQWDAEYASKILDSPEDDLEILTEEGEEPEAAPVRA